MENGPGHHDPDTGSARPKPGRSISTATGVVFGGVFPGYLIASLAISIRGDFSFSNAELGFATALCFGLSSIASAWGGAITARLGLERSIYLSTALVVVACLTAAGLASSALWLIVLLGVIGLGTGIAAPNAAALLARDVGVGRQGTAFGVLTSAPQVGAFAAGLALPLVAHPFGWRYAFLIAAGLSLFFALLVPRRKRPAGSGDSRSRPRPTGRRRRAVLVAAVASGLASAAGLGARYFLVIFAVGAGFTEAGAGLLLGASALLAIVTRFGVGILGDRRPGDAFGRAAALMLVCAAGLVAMAVGGKLLIVIGAMLSGGLGWGWQSPLSLGVVERNRDAPAAAVGLQMSGFFLGAVIGPLIVGLWAEAGSFTGAWLTCAALALAAAAATILAREVGRE